jgi:hypothetical protein
MKTKEKYNLYNLNKKNEFINYSSTKRTEKEQKEKKNKMKWKPKIISWFALKILDFQKKKKYINVIWIHIYVQKVTVNTNKLRTMK